MVMSIHPEANEYQSHLGQRQGEKKAVCDGPEQQNPQEEGGEKRQEEEEEGAGHTLNTSIEPHQHTSELNS